MPRPAIEARVIVSFLRDHPQIPMHYKEIAEAMGKSPDGVMSAIARIAREHPEFGVARVAGGTYMFKQDLVGKLPEQAPAGYSAPMMYEEVGTAQDGSVIVRDEKGILWKLSGQI